MEPDPNLASLEAESAGAGDHEAFTAENERERQALLQDCVSQRTSELIQSNIELRAALEKNEAIAASLARSEARMRLITDSIPALVAYFGSDRRYHFANRGYGEWFGLDTGNPEGIRARQYLGEETYSRIRPFVMQAMSGQPVTFEYEVQTVHRGHRIARTSLIPDIDSQGGIAGCFELTFDITDERLAQERLSRAQKMEALGQLTGGLAHDFNNILTVIQGNLTALSEIAAARSYVDEYIQPALDAAARGSDLLKGLLSFARKHPLSSRVEDLNGLVAATAKLLWNTLPDSLRLHCQLGQQPIPVKLDPNQLQNALINLALNARDATLGRGKLTMRCEAIDLTEQAAERLHLAPGAYARITVEDDGCGMDQATIARVFEPFFTTKAPGQGSGLGMSMVYGFVQQSGGSLDISSTPGQGTTVILLFPRFQPAAEAPASKPDGATRAQQRQEGRRGLALLVEDDAAVRKVLRRDLLDIGFSVIEAENAREAIDLIDHTEHVRLLLTDVVMPGELDGLDVVEHARASRKVPRIVIMSGYMNEKQAPAGVALLQKPFSRQQLAAMLKETE